MAGLDMMTASIELEISYRMHEEKAPVEREAPKRHMKINLIKV